jgi:hypothetical protein
MNDKRADVPGARPVAAPTQGGEAARTAHISFAALRHPAYRGYFITAALAMMADNIEHVISYWLLFERFHSPALAGVAVLTHWLPFLLFSVYAGALADRFDLRRIIQIAQILFMSVSLGWAVMFLTGHIAVWHAPSCSSPSTVSPACCGRPRGSCWCTTSSVPRSSRARCGSMRRAATSGCCSGPRWAAC